MRFMRVDKRIERMFARWRGQWPKVDRLRGGRGFMVVLVAPPVRTGLPVRTVAWADAWKPLSVGPTAPTQGEDPKQAGNPGLGLFDGPHMVPWRRQERPTTPRSLSGDEQFQWLAGFQELVSEFLVEVLNAGGRVEDGQGRVGFTIVPELEVMPAQPHPGPLVLELSGDNHSFKETDLGWQHTGNSVVAAGFKGICFVGEVPAGEYSYQVALYESPQEYLEVVLVCAAQTWERWVRIVRQIGGDETAGSFTFFVGPQHPRRGSCEA